MSGDLWSGAVWDARRWLWDFSSLRSVRNCGRGMRDLYVDVRSQARGHVRTIGTQRCSSVWACPLCMSRIVGARREQLVQVVGRWDQVTFGTLTVPHSLGRNLAERRLALQAAWKAATRHLRRDYGPWRYLRVLEATPGRDRLGHPHFHLIVEREEVALALRERWLDVVPGSAREAQHLRPGDALGAVNYLSQEAFGAWSKNSAHWSVLRAAVQDPAYTKEWRDIEQGLKGARQLVMSRGLLREAGLDEILDQDIPEEPLEEFVLDSVGKCAWMLLKNDKTLLAQALAAWASWDVAAVDFALQTIGAKRYGLRGIHGPGCACDFL